MPTLTFNTSEIADLVDALVCRSHAALHYAKDSHTDAKASKEARAHVVRLSLLLSKIQA